MTHLIDRNQIAAWHRQEGENLRKEASKIQAAAQYHFDAADMVERGGAATPDDAPPVAARRRRTLDSGPVTIERLRSYLQDKGGRVIHVAARLGVAQDVIQKLIEAKDSGIVVAPRGWLKLAGR